MAELNSVWHALAGSLASGVSLFLCYPLDIVRTRKQLPNDTLPPTTRLALKQIIKKEGPMALYHGLRPTLVAHSISYFVYFYWYSGLTQLIKAAANKKALSTVDNLFVAWLAGTINVIATAPLWVVAGRIKSQYKDGKGEGFMETFVKIREKIGLAGFWSGTVASLVLVANPTINFAVYEFLKRKLLDIAKVENNGLAFFILGALSKFVATYATYPLQVAQTRMRGVRYKADKPADTGSSSSSSSSISGSRTSFVQWFSDALRRDVVGLIVCLKNLYVNGGVASLYKGINAKLWQTVLTSAFMFLAYEKLQRLILSVIAKI